MATFNVRVYLVLDLQVDAENIDAAKAMAEKDTNTIMNGNEKVYPNILEWDFAGNPHECYDENGEEVA
jgi:hypothetical protein